MREASTIASVTRKAPPAAPTPVPTRLKVRPRCRLTRAHLAVAVRPQLVAEANALLQSVAAHLSEQLGVTVALSARLADATLHPFSHLARQAVFALVELHGDAVGVLEVDALATAALLERIAGTAPGTSGVLSLTRIEEAAFGWLLLSTLTAVRADATATSRYAPRLISFHVDRGPILETLDARRRHVGIELDVQVGEARGHARLVLPSLWLQATAEALPESAPAELAQEIGEASLEARCFLGRMQLDAADASELVPGDVVVFKDVARDGDALLGPARLVTKAFELSGDFGAGGFTLTRATERTTLETPMSDVDPSLPVDVEIELARLRLPLQQLATLRPGGVLPLHVNTAQAVIIRIGDKAVAKAELVEIEGEIGARILSLL